MDNDIILKSKPEPPTPIKFWHSQKKVWLGAVLVIISVALIGFWLYWRSLPTVTKVSSSPVPKNIARSVSFPVYYPDQKKMPTGYALDLNSFSSPVKNGVAYTVNYDIGKKIVFSVQTRPSDNELQSFNNNYIPLRLDYQTTLGQAEIGAYHLQTLISLPVINGPWIVITAPSDINQDQLKQVLRALKTFP